MDENQEIYNLLSNKLSLSLVTFYLYDGFSLPPLLIPLWNLVLIAPFGLSNSRFNSFSLGIRII